MSPAEFKAWLADAAPGASITWHTGFLARERRAWKEPLSHGRHILHAALPGLDQLAKAVARAADAGSVVVTQRRTGPDQWEYRAVRSLPPAARMRGYSVGRRIIPLEARA